jgi:hypothetical protein
METNHNDVVGLCFRYVFREHITFKPLNVYAQHKKFKTLQKPAFPPGNEGLGNRGGG